MAPTDHCLEQECAQVVRDYFPRWRQWAQWTLKGGARAHWQDARGTWRHTSELGYCDSTAKTIWVKSHEHKTAAERTATLIHECVHAVTTGYHGHRFYTRLQQAADHAKALGDPAVSTALMEDAACFQPGVRHSTRSRLYIVAVESLPTHHAMTYDDLVDVIADALAMTGPEVLACYQKPLRQVFTRTTHDLIASMGYNCASRDSRKRCQSLIPLSPTSVTTSPRTMQ